MSNKHAHDKLKFDTDWEGAPDTDVYELNDGVELSDDICKGLRYISFLLCNSA